MGASPVRWTLDTERAFLLALRAEGQVVRAAAAIGRSPGRCYERRRRSPAFAEKWDAVLASLEAERLADAGAARAAGPVGRPLIRARRDGWTQQRQRAFGRALADTGSYGQAAARVGISMTSVQRLRRRSPEFQALCDRALTEGGPTPEEAARQRAIEGWEEPVFQGGKLVGHRRRWSDALLRDMLKRPAAAVPASPAPAVPTRRERWQRPKTLDEVRESILTKLEAFDRQDREEERAAQLAWCERMEREGKAP